MYLPDRALELWLSPVDVMIPVSRFATLFGLLISDDITSSAASSQGFYILVIRAFGAIVASALRKPAYEAETSSSSGLQARNRRALPVGLVRERDLAKADLLSEVIDEKRRARRRARRPRSTQRNNT